MGDLVAARVKERDGDENWILAEVLSFHSGTNKYEIMDIDEEGKEWVVKIVSYIASKSWRKDLSVYVMCIIVYEAWFDIQI